MSAVIISGTVPAERLADALSEVVSDVLHGQQVQAGRERLDIQGALGECFQEDDRDDMLARLLVVTDGTVLADLQSTMKNDFEKRLRVKLAGSPIVLAMADKLAERES